MIDLSRFSSDRPILIAEIGGNHNGDLDYAYELARRAAEAGADVVKFQTYTADGLVNPNLAADRHAHFKRLELPAGEWKRLADYVRGLDVEWLTSLWDMDIFDEVERSLPAFKVGSGDFTNFPFLRRAVATHKPLILSTAMCTLDDVRRTVDFLVREDPLILEESRLALLQCTAMYDRPTDLETHLAVIPTFRQSFPGVVVGYSNHYAGLEACEAALALGAEILEVHFTTDRDQDYRDHRLSLLPEELSRLRDQCERIPALVGGATKSVRPLEAEEAHRFRRGTFACRDISVGETISEDDLVTLRPEVGIPAWQFYEVVGRRAARAIKAYEPLAWHLFEAASKPVPTRKA